MELGKSKKSPWEGNEIVGKGNWDEKYGNVFDQNPEMTSFNTILNFLFVKKSQMF